MRWRVCVLRRHVIVLALVINFPVVDVENPDMFCDEDLFSSYTEIRFAVGFFFFL